MIQFLFLSLSLVQVYASQFGDFDKLQTQFINQTNNLGDSQLDRNVKKIATQLFNHQVKEIYNEGYSYADVANVFRLILTTNRGLLILSSLSNSSEKFQESFHRLFKIFSKFEASPREIGRAFQLQEIVFYLSKSEDQGFDAFELVAEKMIALLASATPHLKQDPDRTIEAYSEIMNQVFDSSSSSFRQKVCFFLKGDEFRNRFDHQGRSAMKSMVSPHYHNLAMTIAAVPLALGTLHLAQKLDLIPSILPTITTQNLVANGILAALIISLLELLRAYQARAYERMGAQVDKYLMTCQALLK